MSPLNKTYIALDLGATKCAAGIVIHNTATNDFVCHARCSVKLLDASSIEELIALVESSLHIRFSDADAICIGAAGLYDGEKLQLAEPYPYSMHFRRLASEQNWPCYAVIHDYAPIVCATFTSYMQQAENVKRLNHCEINLEGRRVALGIGTGLGMKDGVLFSNGDFWLGQNEIGHIGITTPPTADVSQLQRHKALIHFLENKTRSPVTFEKILSGPGLANLHQFFYPNQGCLSPSDVGAQLQEGNAAELLSAFSWYLGLFIGTVQLIFMPEGGIWITGGVALHHVDVFNQPEFFQGVWSSPAYTKQREQYPLGVLCSQDHALMGGGYYASKKLV